MFQAVFTCFSPYLGIGRWGGGGQTGMVHNLLMQLFTLDSQKIDFFDIVITYKACFSPYFRSFYRILGVCCFG